MAITNSERVGKALQVPLWRGNHLGVKQLVDDFAKYLYLPRVKTLSPTRTITTPLPIAIAASKLAVARLFNLNANSVVVQPAVAAAQIEKDTAPPRATVAGDVGTAPGQTGEKERNRGQDPRAPILRRFHGSATIDATRLSRDVDAIAIWRSKPRCRTLRFETPGFEES